MTEDIESHELYRKLETFALDLIWSWNHHCYLIWKKLNPILWDLTHNPWDVLRTVSPEKLNEMKKDSEFMEALNELLKAKEQEAKRSDWFSSNHPNSPLSSVVYFSMEYMLSEALPIYSGGLGNVAGDQLKAASDLNVPVTGIGLLYQQGYFRQMIDKNGRQQAYYPFNDPGQLPIRPLRDAKGDWFRIEFYLPGYSVWARVWEVKVGKVNLYLLDTNDPANYPPYRTITNELYGDGRELRLMQELILGIGGWRLVEALGLKPEVCHLNEGHAAFAILARAKSYMEVHQVSFQEALQTIRAGNLFTTHTAVPAAFDRFSPELMKQYLENYAETRLKISMEELMALGRENPNDKEESFNMGYLAMRGCGAVNGVSQLHSLVSQKIFQPLFPRWPECEVPIGSVTNGIHVPSWHSAAADKLWSDECGEDRWLAPTEKLTKLMRQVPYDKLWNMRNTGRKALVEYAKNRFKRQSIVRGMTEEEIKAVIDCFDPNVLTLGFARRFATYKRPNMLLQDKERLLKILKNDQQPVQLIIAGKAYPTDEPGKEMIHEWIEFIQRHSKNDKIRVVFLSDYDMSLTEKLVQGVDIWINTPRRPWEACGTSGMKILANGGLNLSELDGWWVEAYSEDVGWALGDCCERGDDQHWDKIEGQRLYDILEKEVIPLFYARDRQGIPVPWLDKVRESMATLTPRFSANRSVREYTEKYYIPAAESIKARMKSDGSYVRELFNWEKSLKEKWGGLAFKNRRISSNPETSLFECDLYLGEIHPEEIKVELFSDGVDWDHPEMHDVPLEKMENGWYRCKKELKTTRSADYYTFRVVPYFKGLAVPLENNLIYWQGSIS